MERLGPKFSHVQSLSFFSPMIRFVVCSLMYSGLAVCYDMKTVSSQEYHFRAAVLEAL